ncbi:MAG TPA: bacillithiol transferase BstA [Symbiobacteriaceae bacterium]|nr:bacillithiol transferase BstA [Symbiobacteriaceae bacterium]
MDDLRYPIGTFTFDPETAPAQRQSWIEEIAAAPAKIRAAVAGLAADQLDTPYRESGWTVRQVIHHLADSHLNSYVRFKLALTETDPTIKPYDETRWAEMPDARIGRAEISLELLEALHERWTITLRAMSEADFGRAFIHPDMGRVTLDRALALYAWHCRHHTAHITSLRSRMGW